MSCSIRIIFLALSTVVFGTSVVQAYDSRLQIDPTANLAELARSNEIPRVVFSPRGRTYQADASAVLSGVDFDRLFAASYNFDNYVAWRMPNLEVSRVIDRAGNDYLYTWNEMSTAGQVSGHYLEVHILRQLPTAGAVGTEWQLVHQRPSWPEEEDPQILRMDGSWYMQRLPDGKIYVRYFMSTIPDTRVPSFIVTQVMRMQVEPGIRRVIAILANKARIRPSL